MSQQQKSSRIQNHCSGRWTNAQCQRFLIGYERFGRDWAQVAKIVKTRSLTQVRSHAQKVLMRKQVNGLEDNAQNSDQISYQDQSSQEQNSKNHIQIKVTQKQQNDKQKNQNYKTKTRHNSTAKKNMKQRHNKQNNNCFKTRVDISEKMIQANISSSSTSNVINFPSRESLATYIKSYDNPSFMIQCLLSNWDHFSRGGQFLQLPITGCNKQNN